MAASLQSGSCASEALDNFLADVVGTSFGAPECAEWSYSEDPPRGRLVVGASLEASASLSSAFNGRFTGQAFGGPDFSSSEFPAIDAAVSASLSSVALLRLRCPLLRCRRLARASEDRDSVERTARRAPLALLTARAAFDSPCSACEIMTMMFIRDMASARNAQLASSVVAACLVSTLKTYLIISIKNKLYN